MALMLVDGGGFRSGRASDNSPAPVAHTAPHRQDVGEVARTHGVTRAAIVAANPQLTRQPTLAAGDRVMIPQDAPSKAKQHIVQSGETPKSIAQQHKTSEQALREENGLGAHDNVYPGEHLNIPESADSVEKDEPADARPTGGAKRGDAVTTAAARTDKAAANVAATKLPSADALRVIPHGEREELVASAHAAKRELSDAVDAEINARANAPGQPPLTFDTLYASAADAVTSRFTGKPGADAVKEAVDERVTARAEKAAESKASLEQFSAINKTLDGASKEADPQKALADVNALVTSLPPEKQTQVLADARVAQVVQRAADYAREPLDAYVKENKKVDGGSQGIGEVNKAISDSTERVVNMTSATDPRLVTMLVDKETTNIDKAMKDLGIKPEDNHYYLLGATKNLTMISGRAFGADNSEKVIERVIGLAGVNGWNESELDSALVEDGQGPAFQIRRMQLQNVPPEDIKSAIGARIDIYARQEVGPAYEKFVAANEDLVWLVGNGKAAGMSTEQLEAAVNEYVEKNPELIAKSKAAEANLGDHGASLITQITQLHALTGGGAIDKIKDIAGQPAATAAIKAAAGGHPELLTGDAGLDVLDAFNASRDVWNKQGGDVVELLAGKYMTNTLARNLSSLNPKDPKTYEIARRELNNLVDGKLAKALGIPENELGALTDRLGNILEEGRNPKRVRQDLGKFLKDVDDSKFSAAARGVMKGLGVTFTAAGLYSAGSTFLDKPGVINGIDTAVNLGETVQAVLKGKEFESAAGKFITSEGFGKILGGAGAAVDLYKAADAAFFGKDHDYVNAGLYATGGAGSLLITFGSAAWTGPVGFAMVAVSVLGKAQYDSIVESNKHMNSRTSTFFENAGFDPDAARALSDQTKDGVSPIPLIMAVGKAQGKTREETIKFINDMSPGELARYRDNVIHWSIDVAGDELSLEDLAKFVAGQLT